MFDPEDPAAGYALLWPRQLFGRELKALLDGRYIDTELGHRMVLLFEEAFVGPHPAEDAGEATRRSLFAGLGTHPSFPARELAKQVLRKWSSFPQYFRKQYYRERNSGYGPPEGAPSSQDQAWEWTHRELSDAISMFDGQGYFDRYGGHRCDDDATPNTHNDTMHRLIEDHSGLDVSSPHWWAENRDKDDFLTFIEVMHDLIARPRKRSDHQSEKDDDRHHYSDFNERTGQAVYRWKVNAIFSKYEIKFRIAEEGEDLGHVVNAVRDPRSDLEREVRHNVPDGEENRQRIEHAISLFRRRNASTEEKRSACVTLASVLESRRPLLRSRLHEKDEGALFEIANKYRIRHHRADQYGDYAEEFLDWIFWNYLAAVELSNRLMARSPSMDRDDA
ncbi:hypothetical protein V3G39_17905 (plasmid) [Dermatophilaceae bacterium Sec6.4]